MENSKNIWIVDDDKSIRWVLEKAFTKDGLIPRSFEDPTQILAELENELPDVIISDIYVENASFLRMDNMTLGYTFSDISKGLNSVRIWGGVQNVFTITNYSGLDPEVTDNDSDLTLTQGIDNVVYPRPRTILVGANFKF